MQLWSARKDPTFLPPHKVEKTCIEPSRSPRVQGMKAVAKTTTDFRNTNKIILQTRH
jgi:hypothetical protein